MANVERAVRVRRLTREDLAVVVTLIARRVTISAVALLVCLVFVLFDRARMA